MTPKEKAVQLVDRYITLIKYDSVFGLGWHDVSMNEEGYKNHKRAIKDAKRYALAAADEVIEQELLWVMIIGKGNSTFWKEVKKEIKKI